MRIPVVTVAAAVAAAQLALLAPSLQAQRPDRAPRERAEQRIQRAEADSLRSSTRARLFARPLMAPRAMVSAFSLERMEPDRAMVGVAIGEASPRGLAVAEVTAGGPAERAGIRAGDRLTAIDGTSLRVAAADSGDALLSGAVARRLTRRLDTLSAGDTVVLQVAGSDGAERTVRLATVRADALQGTSGEVATAALMARAFGGARGAAAIGLTTRATRTARDTLGLFVSAVVAGGPADRAGIHEGMRIVAVNGADLRVNPADVGDRAVATSRAARLEQALAAAEPGERVTLRVRDGAELRDATVEAGRP